MLESSRPVYRALPLSALCVLHIFLKATGCLPEVLLSSLSCSFFRNIILHLICSVPLSLCFFLAVYNVSTNTDPSYCPFQMMLILFIWAVHCHLDGHLLKRRPWRASLSPLRGMCQDTLGKHGWVLFCFAGFLPPSHNTLFAPPLKEKKNPRIWIAWNELNQSLSLQENFAQNPNMTPLRSTAVSSTITSLSAFSLAWHPAECKLTRWSPLWFLLLCYPGLRSLHKAQVWKALWLVTAAEGTLVASMWLSYWLSLERGGDNKETAHFPGSPHGKNHPSKV